MNGILYFIGFYLVGEFLTTFLFLPIPGSIIGLSLALCFIVAFPGRLPELRVGSALLLRFLPLFLTPIVVVGVFDIFVGVNPDIYIAGLVTLIALVAGVLTTAIFMNNLIFLRGQGKKKSSE